MAEERGNMLVAFSFMLSISILLGLSVLYHRHSLNIVQPALLQERLRAKELSLLAAAWEAQTTTSRGTLACVSATRLTLCGLRRNTGRPLLLTIHDLSL